MQITTLTNPRQTVLVTCRDKDNIITLDWHTPLSFYPMMYAISVGKTRYSLELIRKSKCSVVNFISKDYEKEKRRSFFVENIKIIKETEVGDHILFIAEVIESGIKRGVSGSFIFGEINLQQQRNNKPEVSIVFNLRG